MDDQHDGWGPSARDVATDGEAMLPAPPAQATGPPADRPASELERWELRLRVAELAAAIDTIAAALRDAHAAGLRVTPRQARLLHSAAAADRLLRILARRLE